MKTHFGFSSFRPMQEGIMQRVMQGKNALVIMPTGGGKSVTYQVPALALPGLTLVISPLIALMKDQVDALTANGIAAAYLNSTLTSEAYAKIVMRVQQAQLKLLYVAPEQLASARFRDVLAGSPISLLAIDEAHCISEWGHDFRPEYRAISEFRKKYADIPVIALTATATSAVKNDIQSTLCLAQEDRFESSFDRTNLTYRIEEKHQALKKIISVLQTHQNESAIIYCFSRNDVEKTADALKKVGIRALPYHAGLSTAMRSRHQEAFIRDTATVMVATIAFGMGIDKPDIRWVFHRDMPKSLEGYYQETGRAGRDGLPATCVLYYSAADRRKHDFFIREISDAKEREKAQQKLAAMMSFCETLDCRRHFVLRYFGEAYVMPNGGCGGCDICLPDGTQQEDVTSLAQKILSAVVRTEQRFGATYITSFVRGEADARMAALGHVDLPTFGSARDDAARIVRQTIRVLEHRGLLASSDDQYRVLRITQEGADFLKLRKRFFIPRMARVADARKRLVQHAKVQCAQSELEQMLRAWRKKIASENDMPPFVVFGDRTLYALCSVAPRTHEELLSVTGIGAHKCALYGDALLALVRQYTAT